MADLISLIGAILSDRNAKANRAASAQESAADRASRLNEFNQSQQAQREQFAEQMRLNTSKFGLDQSQVQNQVNQFAQSLSNQQSQFEKSLASSESKQKNADLMQLSQLFGQGAKNQGQADILSMLSGNLGVKTNSGQLLNSGMGGYGGSPASTSYTYYQAGGSPVLTGYPGGGTIGSRFGTPLGYGTNLGYGGGG